MRTVIERDRWSSDLNGDLPLSEAAHTIVERRLESLPRLLAGAREFDDRDPEPVHRLRVATRRADAALNAFRPCFGSRAWKRMRKTLRRVRRAAANARACDVDLLVLGAECVTADDADRVVLEYALAETRWERTEAQTDLELEANRYPPKKMTKRIRKLLSSGPPASSAAISSTLADAARNELPVFVERVREAGDDDLDDLENLHELRIRSKTLRYAMELFAPCFDSVYRERLYPPIKKLQELLGEINDEHEIAERYDRLASADAPDAIVTGLRRLAGRSRSRRDAKRDAFTAHWAAFRDRCVLTTIDQCARQVSGPRG